MNTATLNMLIAGVAFGSWPLLMNRSGLPGVTAAMVFSGLAFAFVAVFALKQGVAFSGSDWRFALAAGLAGAFGLVFFNNGLAQATPKEVSLLFVIMILVQISVPVIYHVAMNGEVTLRQGLGFLATLIAIVLLV